MTLVFVDSKTFYTKTDISVHLRTYQKSTSGNCQFLGNNLISWASKRQATIALSTAEAEYISVASCCTQLLWMKHQLEDYHITETCIPIYCDNTAAIYLSKNPILHSRAKHIEIKHHFYQRLCSKRGVRYSIHWYWSSVGWYIYQTSYCW